MIAVAYRERVVDARMLLICATLGVIWAVGIAITQGSMESRFVSAIPIMLFCALLLIMSFRVIEVDAAGFRLHLLAGLQGRRWAWAQIVDVRGETSGVRLYFIEGDSVPIKSNDPRRLLSAIESARASSQ
jgi:hypothetical protein